MIVIDRLIYSFGKDGLTIWGQPGHSILVRLNPEQKLAFAQNAAKSAIDDMAKLANPYKIEETRRSWIGDL